MTVISHQGTRERLLKAAVEQVAGAPGRDISMRAVCAVAGVKMPTLYHFFGNKQGLLDAVAARGFELYLGQKQAQEHSGDAIQDIRNGWDTHVAFGIANPGLYALMYGSVKPGHSPNAQSAPSEILRTLTRDAARRGRLVVDPNQAAAHVLAANIGVTLRQIVLGAEDPPLSRAVREGVIAAITGTADTAVTSPGRRTDIHRVLERAAEHPEILGNAETQLLTNWLHRLAASDEIT